MAQQINMGYQRNVMVTVEPRSDDEAGRCHFKFGKGVLHVPKYLNEANSKFRYTKTTIKSTTLNHYTVNRLGT